MFLKMFLMYCWFSKMVPVLQGDCPRLCDCKWKSGKESVFCPNANLTVVPNQLDIGTQFVEFTDNPIGQLRNDEFHLAGLLNLQKIYITKCRIRTIQRYAFRNLINLVDLDLSYNLLVLVPSQALSTITELRELKLNGNPIEIVPNNTFQYLSHLIRLELSHCRLTTIGTSAFSGLEHSLIFLKLDTNRLRSVPVGTFWNLKKLHGLELAMNPWNCTCGLWSFRDWMLRQNVPFGVPPVCSTPHRLHGKLWDRLDLDEFACRPVLLPYHNRTISGTEGGNITLICGADSTPPPQFKWTFKNRPIALNNSPNLTVIKVTQQDAGIYTCRAENRAGTLDFSVTLTVLKQYYSSYSTNFLLVTNRVVIVCVICSVFVLISILCLVVLFVYRGRWRHSTNSGTNSGEGTASYEKIELNHHHHKYAVANQRENGGSGGEYRVLDQIDLDPMAGSVVPDDEEETLRRSIMEKGWNSPEHLLDPEDLHIPRRTLQETSRGDTMRNSISTFGTSNPRKSSGIHRPDVVKRSALVPLLFPNS